MDDSIGCVMGIVAMCSVIYFCFTVLGGINYHRYSFLSYTEYHEEIFSVEELEKLCKSLADDMGLVRKELGEDTDLLAQGPDDFDYYAQHSVLSMQMVEQYGGIPEELYTKEIMDIFLPILRADFIILDRYKFQPKAEKIRCGISVFYADNDFSVQVEKVGKWTDVAEGNVKFHKFKGEHFFLNRYPNDIINFIVKDTETKNIYCKMVEDMQNNI